MRFHMLWRIQQAAWCGRCRHCFILDVFIIYNPGFLTLDFCQYRELLRNPPAFYINILISVLPQNSAHLQREDVAHKSATHSLDRSWPRWCLPYVAGPTLPDCTCNFGQQIGVHSLAGLGEDMKWQQLCCELVATLFLHHWVVRSSCTNWSLELCVAIKKWANESWEA